MKYIYTHLGLGDHIICNGLVRSLTTAEERYTLFVKPQNRVTVSFMYKDLSNICFHEADDRAARQLLRAQVVHSDNLIVAGPRARAWSFKAHLMFAMQQRLARFLGTLFRGAHPRSPADTHFDESFYLDNNLPFMYRWSHFFVERDLHSEYALFKKFGVRENEYVFIHDDISRGFCIDESCVVNRGLPLVRPIPGLTDNAFDYCYLMAHSRESHFIDSSFRLIFDSLQLRNNFIYFHIHLRNGIVKDPSTHSQSILNFVIV